MTLEELRARCESVLNAENYTLGAKFTCPACGEQGSRAWWTAEHILAHMRAAEWRDTAQRDTPQRKIETD